MVFIVSLSAVSALQTGVHHYVYLSDQRIVTVERVDRFSSVLNYINLGDTFEILEAPSLVFLDREGKGFRGHVFRIEESDGLITKYKPTALVRPGEFAGLTVMGKFPEETVPAGALLKVGSRILDLEGMPARDFDTVAARVEKLDMSAQDMKRALERAGFHRGFGNLHFSGSAEAEPYQHLFVTLDVLGPVLLESPAPLLPFSKAALPDPVVVLISALITPSGQVRNVQVVEGVDPDLDRLAVDTVTDSWIFLPAISKSETAGAEIKLQVVFRR